MAERRRRGRFIPERTPIEAYQEQLKRGLGHSLDTLIPNITPDVKEALYQRALYIDPNQIKGIKNMDVLAVSLLIDVKDYMTRDDILSEINNIVPPDVPNGFKEEVLVYLTWFYAISRRQHIPDTPDWTNTWLDVDLTEPYE